MNKQQCHYSARSKVFPIVHFALIHPQSARINLSSLLYRQPAPAALGKCQESPDSDEGMMGMKTVKEGRRYPGVCRYNALPNPIFCCRTPVNYGNPENSIIRHCAGNSSVAEAFCVFAADELWGATFTNKLTTSELNSLHSLPFFAFIYLHQNTVKEILYVQQNPTRQYCGTHFYGSL